MKPPDDPKNIARARIKTTTIKTCNIPKIIPVIAIPLPRFFKPRAPKIIAKGPKINGRTKNPIIPQTRAAIPNPGPPLLTVEIRDGISCEIICFSVDCSLDCSVTGKEAYNIVETPNNMAKENSNFFIFKCKIRFPSLNNIFQKPKLEIVFFIKKMNLYTI